MSNTGKEVLIYNKTMTLANTEYSQALPYGTVKIMVQNRGAFDTKISFTSGASGTNYFTLKSSMVYYDDFVDVGRTLYFQCADAGKTLEIMVWVK